MELTNDFRVSAPPDKAWAVLTDVERIAPLLPGAQLQEIDGDEYHGIVKVKVGPITAQYKGTATFEERDEAAGRVVLKASGRDTRGQGNASALITVTLAPDGDGTKVDVVTDLTITGKVAQFGRGVLADVSGKLMGQFVDALEADLQGGGSPAATTESGPASPEATGTGSSAAEANGAGEADSAGEADGARGTPSSSTGPRKVDHPEPEPVDLVEVAGGSVAKRLVPLLGVVGVVLLFLLLRRPAGAERAMSGGSDAARVAALLGRPPQGRFEIAVRDAAGEPAVIRNTPFLDDGTPMPTRYWLVDPGRRRAVDRLESAGGVRAAEAAVDPGELAAAHRRYAEERDGAIPAGWTGPRPSGGVGGTRRGVKCLHAHYAWYLAGGDDPVGRWVADRLGRDG